MRIDLHLHSRYSHDSNTSLEALVQRCRECGLDRIALTDHNTVEGALKLAAMAPELTIVGEEAKTREGEVIGLFIKRRIPPYLRPEEAMAEAMLHGWRAQQTARGLRAKTIGARERLVRRFVAFTNEFPWRWSPGHVDEWTLTLTAEHHLAPATIRG